MTRNIHVPVRRKALPENTKIVTAETLPCKVCGKRSLVAITSGELARLQKNEEFVQDIFSDSDPDFRELLITGTHGKCWSKMFGDEF